MTVLGRETLMRGCVSSSWILTIDSRGEGHGRRFFSNTGDQREEEYGEAGYDKRGPRKNN
jgi:hypothetical protein